MAQYNLGLNLRKLGELSRSIEHLRKATDLDKDNPIAYNNLGLSLFENRDYRDAMEAFSKAIELSQAIEPRK